MGQGLNDDFSIRVALDTRTMDWQASPSATVWRKRLDLSGPVEAGRVTSLVRYDPGSSFAAHPHPDGEEILVLQGVFSDDSGDYPAGSYLLNPQGFEHAPRSAEGCVLFVKLRQYPGIDRRHVTLQTPRLAWTPDATRGVAVKPLYGEPGRPETMALLRLNPGTRLPLVPGGNEIFVIEGMLVEGDAVHGPGCWLRLPSGAAPELHATGVTGLYLKSGHLTDA